MFGFYLRNAAGQAWRHRLEQQARAQRGAPDVADGPVMLWGVAAGATRPSGCGSVIAEGIIHNRSELLAELPGCASLDDHALLRRAFEQFGADACGRIQGRWSAAMWDAATRSLLLARDPYGNTSLYYHATEAVFAFASSREELRGLGLATPAIDELYVAQTLICWPGYHSARTVDRAMTRLPPAHLAHVAPERLDIRRFWRLEAAPETRLARREDYVARFNELLDQAVRVRMPAGAPIASTLSAGLDSSAIVLTAAPALAESDRRLTAYVATPIFDPSAFITKSIGDEYALAASTARAAGTVDLRRIDAAEISPIGAMREMLKITGEPQHSAGAYYWLIDLFRTARRDGQSVVLTGQMGNAGISWEGDVTSLPLSTQLRRYGLGYMAKLHTRRAWPQAWERRYRARQANDDFPSTAIHPDLARRLKLRERWLDDPVEGPYRRPIEQRLRFLKPRTSKQGFVYAELEAATGVAIADPTADPRLLEFCLSIPDRMFVDPKTGMDRWLVREAMKGRLPDEVRLNRLRGLQSSDLVPRLRRFAADVEEALGEAERGPGAAFVDTARLRRAWQRIQVEDSPESLRLAISVLTRGLMAALFVNGFGTRW